MKFSKKIILWYRKNKRDLPWRNTKDPYKIWLSEIILQQTRVEQGLNYYLRFIKTFPAIEDLASAEEQQVLKLWQGLGYYSRARNMHFTARHIRDFHKGRFPDEYEMIIRLKGIGEYTAAAIASFAFDLAYPVVDGNVIRLLSRLNGIKDPLNTTEGKKRVTNLAKSLIDHQNPGEFNQAIMEFGALHCKPKNPDCVNCIFRDQCQAFTQNIVSELPLKYGKTRIRKRYFHYFLFIFKTQIILNKRIIRDIWQNLYDFPSEEATAFYTRPKIINVLASNFHIPKNEIQIEHISNHYKHVLSHQHIFAQFYTVKIKKETHFQHIASMNEKQYLDIHITDINQYPLPRLIDKYLTKNQII